MQDHNFRLQSILSLVAQGASTLEKLAPRCGGLYPAELQGYLAELVTEGKIVQSMSGYTLSVLGKPATNLPASFSTIDVKLPVPHPHDYDWRFNSQTVQLLTEMVLAEPGSHVLLLGAPSLYPAFLEQQLNRAVTLIDRSAELVSYLRRVSTPVGYRVVRHDLMTGEIWEAACPVDTVVSDPPWYPEHYQAFLTQAASVTIVGGRILLSLMPLNTRPGAGEDRWQIFETARRLGLHIEAVRTGELTYLTPEFEQASLAASGIQLDCHWRTADLAIFRKVETTSYKTAEDLMLKARALTAETKDWAEVLIGLRKIKLRGPFNDYFVQPELVSLESGNTLPTVSRRYQGRKAIDLWLWDNRVFAVNGKAAFLAALNSLAGKSISLAVTRQAYNHALNLLLSLIEPARLEECA